MSLLIPLIKCRQNVNNMILQDKIPRLVKLVVLIGLTF